MIIYLTLPEQRAGCPVRLLPGKSWKRRSQGGQAARLPCSVLHHMGFVVPQDLRLGR